MALDESKNPEDNVDEAYGVTIVAEKKFEQYLEDAVIDYVATEDGSGFTMKTPRMADCSSGCSSCS
ncbi:Fe-S cluster assembly protein HesB [Dehalobacter sp. DCM]|nr:Fe-S cluster assembly protein HesB [Dehalobacter sp. DCM]